jgi:tRNA(adenine34) deaminase
VKKDPSDFMKQALRLAEKAGRSGEVPVGAVVVRDGRIIGRGANGMIGRKDPTAHAEVAAIRRAAKRSGSYRIVGADLYVTLEPCMLCFGAMVQARIRKLYYGAADPKTGIFSTGVFRSAEGVFNHRIEVEAGLLAESGSALLKEFFRARRGAGAVERDGLENRYTG